jgi:1-aminocyclopropane-1-carboxylate deaminase/D-cysteine desulfhydrase-like pyridoxal-dependent ACC family enzyme
MFPADVRRVTVPFSTPTFRVLPGFGGRLALVDDRACEPILGGNKARKLLGGLLDEARARGADRLFTFGAHGSHHVLATAVLGARAGFEVHAALWPQPNTPHTGAVLAAGLREGLVAHHVQSAHDRVAAWRALRAARAPRTFVIPLGGSTPSTLAAHASAARDLVHGSPEIATFDAVVVPFGSGGTALGLALGLEDALGDRGPEVHGVVVSPPAFGSRALALGLLARAATSGMCTPRTARGAWRRLRSVSGYVGAGYGHTTPTIDAAIAEGAAHGLHLEPTYTGKAFAYARDLAARGLRVAFWMTLGRVPAPTCP